jgi:hypothetical protein
MRRKVGIELSVWSMVRKRILYLLSTKVHQPCYEVQYLLCFTEWPHVPASFFLLGCALDFTFLYINIIFAVK